MLDNVPETIITRGESILDITVSLSHNDMDVTVVCEFNSSETTSKSQIADHPGIEGNISLKSQFQNRRVVWWDIVGDDNIDLVTKKFKSFGFIYDFDTRPSKNWLKMREIALATPVRSVFKDTTLESLEAKSYKPRTIPDGIPKTGDFFITIDNRFIAVPNERPGSFSIVGKDINGEMVPFDLRFVSKSDLEFGRYLTSQYRFDRDKCRDNDKSDSIRDPTVPGVPMAIPMQPPQAENRELIASPYEPKNIPVDVSQEFSRVFSPDSTFFLTTPQRYVLVQDEMGAFKLAGKDIDGTMVPFTLGFVTQKEIDLAKDFYKLTIHQWKEVPMTKSAMKR